MKWEEEEYWKVRKLLLLLHAANFLTFYSYFQVLLNENINVQALPQNHIKSKQTLHDRKDYA